MTNRFFRFVLVGSLNTLFGFAVFSLFALSDLSTLTALIASNIAGMAFNFFTTGSFVFRNLSIAKVPRFIFCYGVIFAIYFELIQWLTPIIGGRIFAMAVILLPMALFTYFLQLWFVFGVDSRGDGV